MPSKIDNIRISDPFLKRSAKLLPCQKEMMHYWYSVGASINSIARMFKVNKRLVQFELFPERHKRNLELRREKGGSMVYYKKEKHTLAMRKNRQYKKMLHDSGLSNKM